MLTQRGCVVRWFCVLLLFSFLPAAGLAQTAKQQVADEVARLRKLVVEQPDDGDLWPRLKPGIEEGLGRIAKDLEAGRTFVALRGLASIRTNLVAYSYLAAHLDIAKGDMKAFEPEWQRMDGKLKRMEQKYRAAQWKGSPAVVQAIAEATWGTARPLFEASRDYGAAAGVKYGFYYLGQAQAAADYAQFCRSLRFEGSAGQMAMRSFAPDTDTLDVKVEAAYQPPFSIDRHSDFITINAFIKRAVELDESRLYYGSLYAYLEGVRSLSDLQSAVPAKEDLPKLEEARATLAKRFDERGRDHSIGRMYLDLAKRELERAQAGEETSGRNARGILEQVLPAYFAALERAAAPTAAPNQKVLTVTLVRWPFT